MKWKKKWLILTLLILQSCSFLTPDLDRGDGDGDGDNDSDSLDRVTKKYIPCESHSKNALYLIGPDSEIYQSEIVSSMQKTKKNGHNLSTEDIFILLTLSYLPYNPHITSPSSPFTILTHDEYFHYTKAPSMSTNDSDDDLTRVMPVFFGLESFIKRKRLKRSLWQYITLYERYFDLTYRTSPQFEIFLANHKKSILDIAQFKTIFSRQGVLLQEGERLFKSNIRKTYQYYKRYFKEQDYLTLDNSSLKEWDLAARYTDYDVKCNFPRSKYESDPKPQQKISQHFSYGLQYDKGLYFAAMSLSPKKIQPLIDDQGFLVHDWKWVDEHGICQLINKQNLKRHTLFSQEGRDPQQFLYHILDYDEQNFNSTIELTQHLARPRHLILNNPPRLIYETSKATKTQLEKILQIQMPIYHASNLGNINALTQSAKGSQSILLDDRNQLTLRCHN